MKEKIQIKRKAEVELKIESLAYGGMGIAKKENFVIFVKNAIPGPVSYTHLTLPTILLV